MDTLSIIVAASAWEIGFTVGGFLFVVGTALWLTVWAQRRRARGEEASTSRGEGAEAMVHPPGFGH